MIGGDLNVHVGRDRNGLEDVMVIDGYGERNVDGENILEMSKQTVENEDKKKITYKNGDRETQVDYILVRVSKKIKFKEKNV